MQVGRKGGPAIAFVTNEQHELFHFQAYNVIQKYIITMRLYPFTPVPAVILSP
jgi:hypothetical protein